MWEDPSNKKGGRISLKLKKDFTSVVWEELVLAFIGNALPVKVLEKVNGILVSIRKDCNMIQVWVKEFNAFIISDVEWRFN